MPYKCTACNKSFRYKISQRTHKCTAQPPGIVVRTQGYLVHRLQAAMNKAAETNESKTSIKEMKNNEESKTTANEANQTSDPSPPTLREIGTSTAAEENNLSEINKSVKNSDIPKIKLDKPQIYLLVKGLNGETYYQPLIFSQNLVTPVVQNSTEQKNDTVPPKCRKFFEDNTIENRIHNVESIHSTNNNDNQSSKTLYKNLSGFSTLTNANSSKRKNDISFNETNDKVGNKDSSVEQKVNSREDPDKCKSVQQNTEMTLVQNTKNSNMNSEMVNGSSIMSELFDNMIYVSNNGSQNHETSDFPYSSRINSNSNSDTIMDSTDLFSLMLSPTLSSPSDKFGRLSLSPNSSINNSLHTDNNYECSPSHSDNGHLINSANVSQDPFFENFTDDSLKELLFGGVK